MNKKPSSDPPEKRKNFPAALGHFLEEQCPSLRGKLIRDRIVQAIIELFEKFYPPTERMKMGQVLWYAIDVNETAGYGKRIEDCKIQPVILNLIHEMDIDNLLLGMKKKQRQSCVIMRLFKKAFNQNAVLTQADVGSLMRLSPGTISRYVREYEKETGETVPRRGTIHDMGRSVTHKRIICVKHFKEGKTIGETSRETYHSPAAVTRYINDYKRVRECLKSHWQTEKIAFATGLSISLTKEYVDLINSNEVSQ
jgi:uncharacterized protein DUF1670